MCMGVSSCVGVLCFICVRYNTNSVGNDNELKYFAEYQVLKMNIVYVKTANLL